MSNSSSRDGLKVCTTTTSLGREDLLLHLIKQDGMGLVQAADVLIIELFENLIGSERDEVCLVFKPSDEFPEVRDFVG